MSYGPDANTLMLRALPHVQRRVINRFFDIEFAGLCRSGFIAAGSKIVGVTEAACKSTWWRPELPARDTAQLKAMSHDENPRADGTCFSVTIAFQSRAAGIRRDSYVRAAGYRDPRRTQCDDDHRG
jgi:hypothetical protein